MSVTKFKKMKIFLLLLLFLNLNSACNSQTYSNDQKTDVGNPEIVLNNRPLFVNRPQNILFEIKFTVNDPVILQKINLLFSDNSDLMSISAIRAIISTNENVVFGTSTQSGKATGIEGNYILQGGLQTIQFDFKANASANLLSGFNLKEIELVFGNRNPISIVPDQDHKYRFATVLRQQNQDNCDTYRIPGLITTNKGTLISVYDNRYNNSKDLQEDIDIGMSRSTDGGQTWQPMRVIMDMGEYGGRSQQLNGTGDPCVLYDHKTNTIWVAALWMSGSAPDQMLWWASKPGMKPEETGQFMLVKSTDDGLTWSKPINITEQIKNPAWQLLLQGPGRGITLADGTLVFPAQFKTDLGAKALDGGQYTCHSTIVYSKDQGKTWHIGTGAKSNTTEAQVVQLGDGSLMLNMRDDRNRKDKSETNGRAVATTSDLGKSWTTHSTSNSALQESNCQASIISTDLVINGKKQQVLFFSNPNSKTDRSHMTIKASLNEGNTWPESMQIKLNASVGFGYSCLTMVNDNTIGIVYEGIKELYFQKIPVTDFIINK